MPWLESVAEVATADIVRCEFLLGINAVTNPAKRRRGEQFYAERVASLASLANEPADYETAARLAGEARRLSKGKRWTPLFGQENAGIKLVFRALGH